MSTDPIVSLPRVTALLPDGEGTTDHIALIYEARLLRRKRLCTAGGLAFLAEFAKATELPSGAVLVLSSGQRIRVDAAPEPLLQVQGDLPRLAWHIGNRHTPCQIDEGCLRIRRDPVMARMLQGLGADLTEIEAPFTPEGGAYGHGRTFGHDHGHDHG